MPAVADPRDPRGLAADAPLLAAYLEALDRREAGEHSYSTPGHKGRVDLTGTVVAGDLCLYGGLDTVKLHRGVLAEAERRAARLWGADVCRFSVGGSTHGNQALVLAVARPGEEVVVSRTLHRSVLLGLVLAGLRPVWVSPDVDPVSGLPAGMPPQRVAAALAAHPGAKAVLLCDPSYVGTFSDLAAHATVAHEAGVPLVVDAAWAAYFGFHPDLPPHPLAAGADAFVTSAHKTLPASSQAALILARTDRLDAARLDRAFEATSTTSPSGSILASIDAARALLARDGRELLGGVLAAVGEARARLRAVPGVHVLEGPGMDPMKLVVGLAGTGAHGVQVEHDLLRAGLPLEMADRDTLVAVVSLADTAVDLVRLTGALTAAVERHRGAPRAVVPAASWMVEPDLVVSPREAFFADTETVPVAEAVGRVSAELVAPYPPGIPVLAPGERVNADALDALMQAREDGVRIAYAADPTLARLQVMRTSPALDPDRLE